MIVDTAHGVALGCDDLGPKDAPAVVLVGGLATQRTVWPDNLCDDLVSRGFRVVRFDNRDLGESAWWDAPSGDALMKLVNARSLSEGDLPYTVRDMAGDVIGLLDALAIERAHLVGMSMGGRIVQEAAIASPDRAMSLVSMMSTTGNPALPPPTPEAREALMTPPRDPFDVDAVTELAIAQQKVIGSPGFPMPEDYIHDVVALNFARGNNPDGVLRQWIASQNAGDRRDALRSVVAPTMVLHGRSDPLVPLAAGEDTAATIKGATLRVIDGWGHNIPPAIGPLLAEALGSFWSSTQ